MIFCGWFDRRDFSMDLTDSLQSLLKLLKLKFEFAFIKYSKFDVSKILFFIFILFIVIQDFVAFTYVKNVIYMLTRASIRDYMMKKFFSVCFYTKVLRKCKLGLQKVSHVALTLTELANFLFWTIPMPQ